MVRKRMIILSLLLCSGMAAGYSQTLSLRKGRSIARQFLNEKMNSTFSGKWQERYFGDGKLMIVNRGDNDGFVIIRSDGDNHTILGYAEHGHINTEAMPENLRYWLQCYAAENEPTTLSYSSNNHEYTAHAPLLATIAWDQNSPYNLMTPYYVGTTHAATGCAATAMAQILYYHHWPLQGKGTVSYSCSTLSDAILYGTAFETPYTDDFTDASTKSLWTIADDNNDKTTWKYDSYNKAWSINTGAYSIKGCDDWLISPAINMKKGYCYAFTANMRNTFRDYKEHVRLLVGTNPEDRKSFKLLAENDAYDTQGNYADWEADFTPEKDGSYYVAVLDSSNTTENCSGVYVKRISVDALGLAGAPTAADSMTVTPEADGALKATITAKAPSKALDGTALTGTLSAALYRDEATTPVAKKDDIVPSATISFVDDKVDSVATHSYSLVFSNGQGAGKKVTAKAFIGIYGDGYKTSARRT